MLHEVVPLDIELAPEPDPPRAGVWLVRMVDGLELLASSLRIVLDDDLERPQHRHPPQRGPIENLAHRMLEHRHVDDTVRLGNPDPLHELANGGRRHAATAQA